MPSCGLNGLPSDSNIVDLPSRGLQQQAAVMINGSVVDPPLDLEAAAKMCEDLTSLPSFAFGGEGSSYDILRELPSTSFLDE